MDITVTGRKTTVTDALRDHVDEKIGSAARVFDIDPLVADVVLRVEKYHDAAENIAEVTLRTKGAVIRVQESDPDMYAAIDKAGARVSRQLRKYKTKVVDGRQRTEGLRGVNKKDASSGQPLSQEFIDEIIGSSAEDEDDELVREKVIDFTVLTEEQALVQTDLLGHDFFVFTNADTGAVNVIYHRKNGGYGILKPKLEEN
ncbi:MAG: ribosome-associated translation inhibitor RaiA [Coriobacteriia bacterium]|nr:ribosome-associated translation inhibitor RaiA [Coriobacteriia bacterium]